MSTDGHWTAEQNTRHSLNYLVAPYLRIVLLACITIILLLLVLIVDSLYQIFLLKFAPKYARAVQQQSAQVEVVPVPAASPSMVWKTYDNSSWPFRMMYPSEVRAGLSTAIVFDQERVELVGFPSVTQHFSLGYVGTNIFPLRVYAFASSLEPAEWWKTVGEAAFRDHLRQVLQLSMDDTSSEDPVYSQELTSIGGVEAVRITATYNQPGVGKKDEFLTVAARQGMIYLFYQPNETEQNFDMVLSNDVLSSVVWREVASE